MKQATIESLSGVVVIEEFERAKIILERSDTSVELRLNTLKNLMLKNPAKEVLSKTSLGKTVHKLCKHENEDIAAEAKKVYKKWKANILSKINRPLIEVECDAKTQNFRRIARQMLLGSLRTKHEPGNEDLTEANESKIKKKSKEKDELGDLAEYIEREVYQTTNRKINNSYKRTIRKLVFSLRHTHELRISVLDSSIPVPELVKDHLKA